MTSQLLLLLRVSKPEYNNTLANDYKLYMNNQFSYNKTANLTKGQYDDTEGLIANSTVRVRYSIDNKKPGQKCREYKQFIKITMPIFFACMV